MVTWPRPAAGDVGFYWVAIVLRMAAELYLVAVIVRDVARPEHDPVRLGETDQSLTRIRSKLVAV